MASVAQVSAAHRSVAERVPAAIRQRLPAEELRYRASYAHRIESGSPQTGEARTAFLRLSRKILNSIPIREYIEQRARLRELTLAWVGLAMLGWRGWLTCPDDRSGLATMAIPAGSGHTARPHRSGRARP